MRKPLVAALSFVFILFLCMPSRAGTKPEQVLSSYTKYVQIPGASLAGSDACAACHDEISKDFQHAFHAQQGIECEQCHGPGSLHIEGAGDVSKIISFRKRSAGDANGVCLSCHGADHSIRHWMAGRHASNKVRCIDCHQTHVYNAKGQPDAAAFVDVTNPGRPGHVENLSPETKAMMQPRWQANDACLKCHETERGQMSLPYHHPLREGKMSCADCHDPHGGPGGRNLRVANANQLCLSCHAQYRGPFAYQHPPVTENCMICHTAHGSPNTNLLSVSEPALCLQCHSGHHNGAGLPLADRCTNCHGSIHGTDTPTPSGGSRFVDKGPSDAQLRGTLRSASLAGSAIAPMPSHAQMAARTAIPLLPSHSSTYSFAASGGAMGLLSRLTPQAGASSPQNSGNAPEVGETTEAAYSIIPASYRFVDVTGYGGRVGEYDTLQQSAGADVATSYVSSLNHLTVVSRGNVISSQDYQASSQVTARQWMRFGLDLRSFVQQQDHYSFYAFPVLDVPPGGTPADTTTENIPSNAVFGVVRRLGSAHAQVKLPKLPVHLFVQGNWQARSGIDQFGYLDENVTPNCGELCHYTSQTQRVNYTTRNIGGGADVDLGPARVTWEHNYSSFNDRLVGPFGTFGPFTPADEPPPPPIPVPPAVTPGNYAIDIPSPSVASSDRVGLNLAASPSVTFSGDIAYSRLRNSLTSYPQNQLGSDMVLNWVPVNRLRFIGEYHQQNLINNFTPFYNLFGNVSYHDHWEGARVEYELGQGFDVEAQYKRNGITRSNASLWPQGYSFDNTDLLTVVPSSFSNTAGLALRYHNRGVWSGRAGYDWTGTHNPGYLVVPQSDNRIFADFTLTPAPWLTLANDTSIIVQNDFRAIPLPNTPGDFERRNRFYINTASATVKPAAMWNLGVGYSYQQNNLTTYMAFQNDSGVNYVVDEPAIPYKQIAQAYWGESTYTLRQRLGLNLRLTYNSARSGFRPDVNPNDAASLGNQSLISSGVFDPVMFGAALNNLDFSATKISEVIVPQWIGQSKAYYLFPKKFEGGLLFYYGSYRDYWNPNLNGDLRTFNVYVGRSW